MRVTPSAGFAYLPAGESSIEEINNGTETRYTYEAGKWGTAVLGGIGFEFGRDNRQAFIFSVNYLQGLGNNEQTKNINNVPGNKTVPTTLSSSSAAWSIKLGFPINLSKRKTSEQKEVIVIKEVQKQEYKCGQSKSQYKSRCYRSYNDQ